MYRIIIVWGVVLTFFCGGSSMLQAQYSQEEIDSLEALADSLHNKWVADSLMVDSLSSVYGFPVCDTLNDGTIIIAVMMIDSLPVYMRSSSLNTAKTISTDKVWPDGNQGFSLDGSTMTIGMWDQGRPLLTHREFDGRIIYKETNANSDNRHSTRMAGVIVGAGKSPINQGDPIAKGTAYDADLWAYDRSDDMSELLLAAVDGIQISNHSYTNLRGWDGLSFPSGKWVWHGKTDELEDREFGRYSVLAERADEVVYNSKYNVVLKSSDNSKGKGPGGTETPPHVHGITPMEDEHDNINGNPAGYDLISHFAVSKNVITVGAVEDIVNGYSQSSDVILASFSNTGPTDDGRIKPDIVANGVNVWAPHSTGVNDYGYDDGTSEATASVTGSIGLLMELYQSLYPVQLPLLASTWKAIVIHTADESGDNNGPDYEFGWGLMNTLSAAELIQDNKDECCNIGEYTLFEGSPTEKGEVEIEVESDGTEPLKVTICWTDPPFTGYDDENDDVDEYIKSLINDLDLVVEGPIGGTSNFHYPWKLDRLSPANAATSAVVSTANSSNRNSADNVEQVVIANPTAGIYRIKVTYDGTSLHDDLQRFSMIVTGNTTESADITLDESIEDETTRYHTSGKITTQAGTSTIFDVEENSDVTLVAGEKIVMKDGSRVREGNIFYAYICDPNDGGGRIKKPSTPRHVVTGDAPYSNGYGLLMTFPNPTSATTTVKYRVAETGRVQIDLVNETGEHILTLLDQQDHPVGDYDVSYDVSLLPSGTYYVTFTTPGARLTQKMLVLR